MSRRGFAPILVLVIVLGVFAVVSIWYYFAVALPTRYQDLTIGSALNQLKASSSTLAGAHAGNTTPNTTFFGGIVQVATTSSGTLSLFLYPSGLPISSVSSDTSVIGVIESSSVPLTNVLIDPKFAGGLAIDSYFKIHVLQSWPSGVPQPSTATGVSRTLNGQRINVVSSQAYLDGFNLVPGDLIMMDIDSCALYDGWPNFICTSSITSPKHWSVAPNNLFVSWRGQNGASISLAGASLDTLGMNSVLSFHVNVTSGYGEFCPSSLLTNGPGLLKNDYGVTIPPIAVLPSACIGPNATSFANIFLPFPTTTSTMLTVNVLGQNGTSQTFFNLYPLPNGQLFLLSASSTAAAGQ